MSHVLYFWMLPTDLEEIGSEGKISGKLISKKLCTNMLHDIPFIIIIYLNYYL